MVTMTINFNESKLNELGLTADTLLAPFNKHCEKHQVNRPAENIFEKDGEHGLASIGIIMYDIWKNDKLMSLIEDMYWEIDGQYEDLLEGAARWKERRKQWGKKKIKRS